MNKIEKILNIKPSKRFIIVFYCLTLLYPILIDSRVLLFGESCVATVVDYGYEVYQSRSRYSKSKSEEVYTYPIIEYNYLEYTYRQDLNISSPYKLKDELTVYILPSDPENISTLSFTYLYLSGRGINVLIAILVFSTLLYVQQSERKGNINERRIKQQITKAKIIKGVTVLLLLVPLMAYLIGGVEYFQKVVMIWVILPLYILVFRLKYSDKALKKKAEKKRQEAKWKAEHVARVRARQNKAKK